MLLKNILSFAVLIVVTFIVACNNQPYDTPDTPVPDKNTETAPANLSYSIINIYPHDEKAYTQGLIWHNNKLIEGTGQEGESNIRVVDLETGKPDVKVVNDANVFGEGITLLGNKLYQLTWTTGKGYVYNAQTFKLLREFPIHTQGWGLTNNGAEIIMSDGSNNLYFFDTTNLRELRRVGVSDNFGVVGNLNELEYIEGFVYANRWQTNLVYKIDPENGKVVARIDFSGLPEKGGFSLKDPHNEVLNGLAWDPVQKRLFVTGKYWPRLFEVKLNP